jgi:AcrR family transcriptional regulator
MKPSCEVSVKRKGTELNNHLEDTTTKQKILGCAAHLFAMKGYTETTVRELAAAVGVKEASLYNHFPSKNAILEYILEEFSQKITSSIIDRDKISALGENPTADGILSCLRLAFPEGKKEYYLKELYVLLQEQYRNPLVRKYVSETIILSTEHVAREIINNLKEFQVLRPDTDPDFWVKTHSSLVYTFASRMLLGIGDNEADFSGMGLVELLRSLFDMMLKTCGVESRH